MKFFIITKKQMIMAICLILSLVCVITGSVGAFAQSDRLLPIYCVETEKKQIAISFDAAWGNAKKVQNLSKAHNYWVCASSVFHKKLNFDALTPHLIKL